jgi:TctA family transporter
MNDWMPLILRWGSLITQAVSLVFQVYAYRRTGHYSLALLVVATVIGLLPPFSPFVIQKRSTPACAPVFTRP